MDAKGVTVVVGLGKTGLSVLRFLKREGFPCVAMDTRESPPNRDQFHKEFPDLPFYFGKLDKTVLDDASRIVVSPGVDWRAGGLAEYRVKITGDVQLFFEAIALQKPRPTLIGITGSNGKSTVTTLMGLVLEEAGWRVKVCGNIGLPVFDALAEADQLGGVDAYVIELSSFQLELMNDVELTTAVFLNLSEDHMDRYDAMDHYLQAKQRIYSHCQHPVVNADEPVLWQGLSLPHPVSFSINGREADFDLPALSELDCRLQGAHHAQNYLAVLAMASALRVPKDVVRAVFSQFPGLPHRCEWVATINGVSYINDSKGTNVGATETAIHSMAGAHQGRVLWIGGGVGKSADFSPLQSLMQAHVSEAILYGQDADQIEQAIKGATAVHRVSDVASAVDLAYRLAKPQDVVLFSPACASFDQFKHFEERGECFKQEVKGLES